MPKNCKMGNFNYLINLFLDFKIFQLINKCFLKILNIYIFFNKEENNYENIYVRGKTYLNCYSINWFADFATFP